MRDALSIVVAHLRPRSGEPPDLPGRTYWLRNYEEASATERQELRAHLSEALRRIASSEPVESGIGQELILAAGEVFIPPQEAEQTSLKRVAELDNLPIAVRIRALQTLLRLHIRDERVSFWTLNTPPGKLDRFGLTVALAGVAENSSAEVFAQFCSELAHEGKHAETLRALHVLVPSMAAAHREYLDIALRLLAHPAQGRAIASIRALIRRSTQEQGFRNAAANLFAKPRVAQEIDDVLVHQ